MTEQVILVDENDCETGLMEKMRVHRQARLHRAFSVLVFNKSGDVLLQRRAHSKYHCGDLWANTCCSHPRKGEAVEQAAHRRLSEEMGFDCPLAEKYAFTYKAELDHGLTEHEFDHVFFGEYDGQVNPNPEEVCETKWIAPSELRKDLAQNPEKYTPWFRKIAEKTLG
ncbi:isopentenyl-diphosphate delta-isomerase [Candidatus Micrarchaeota archaeon CG1_02_51_15]|nr:MAG: isopentenyl-diphosphate delta-isomerase [Candidatus Micrarchaeota archaeon CG1_02_51_15]